MSSLRRAIPFVASALTAAASGFAVNAAAETAAVPSAPSSSGSPSALGLSTSEFRSFAVSSVQRLTRDTVRLRVALPPGEGGLPVAWAVMLQVPGVDESGAPKPVAKPYTPTSEPSARGALELVIKGYPNGAVSSKATALSRATPSPSRRFKSLRTRRTSGPTSGSSRAARASRP